MTINSTNLRYLAAVAQFAIVVLGALGKITPAQEVEIMGGLLGAYHLAQGQLTPDTNQRTPDNAPPKQLT